MTEDARAARQLVAEKEAFRDLEAAATRAHFAGLRRREGGAASDLDLVRELKRVNGHLVAAAAYPVLEGQGELLASRLRLDSLSRAFTICGHRGDESLRSTSYGVDPRRVADVADRRGCVGPLARFRDSTLWPGRNRHHVCCG